MKTKKPTEATKKNGKRQTAESKGQLLNAAYALLEQKKFGLDGIRWLISEELDREEEEALLSLGNPGRRELHEDMRAVDEVIWRELKSKAAKNAFGRIEGLWMQEVTAHQEAWFALGFAAAARLR